jgi:hypothetical protein
MHPDIPLNKKIESIRTKHDFVQFIEALSEDFVKNPHEWENRDLPSFLEAMAAWMNDMEGYYQHTGQNISTLSPWRLFADSLMAAKMYE